ncbi:hypothetical protein GCM10025772_00630 [Ferrimonas gelatinilytica]|uniref:Uncharacterized protein n=2 Tax=Ferrimonas gelatinilytica TaxID=1255257 RepID=A0ABP9RRY8_9GAMM
MCGGGDHAAPSCHPAILPSCHPAILPSRPFAQDVYTITGIQLESTTEFEGFHGVNEPILVEEYGRSIGFFYTLMDNLEAL